MKDARLEKLSDLTRMGIPIDLAEALEVIEYQTKLKGIRDKLKGIRDKRWYIVIWNKLIGKE